MRANIYSLEPLPSETREALIDGVGMVATYMDEPVTTKELTVRLPSNNEGNVDALRVGFGKLDKLVELHLMAVPLAIGVGEVLGLAHLGHGTAFVDTKSSTNEIIRTTTSHEVAHAFGFVESGAKHEDPESSRHCDCDDCIMGQKLMTTYTEIEARRRRMTERLLGKKTEPIIKEIIRKQYDFCGDCKADLWNKGSQKLAELRHGRLFEWRTV